MQEYLFIYLLFCGGGGGGSGGLGQIYWLSWGKQSLYKILGGMRPRTSPKNLG